MSTRSSGWCGRGCSLALTLAGSHSYGLFPCTLASRIIMPPSPTSTPPTTASLRAWWKQFTIVQKLKAKAPSSSSPGEFTTSLTDPPTLLRSFDQTTHSLMPLSSFPFRGVFGVPLRESLRYASVQISTANQNGYDNPSLRDHTF
ncbi:10418_t:CDS:2 [Acaulospora colombiana]|uniref:10418_t:CDS:1 n=1 Tax=Acaulospora colombiana TaxID=27376 RepID=A0ACA9NEQ6_9GLOM|nr:10418_t:CDS:2 [Acaulospora colombiana]